jgi:hypothetical protein
MRGRLKAHCVDVCSSGFGPTEKRVLHHLPWVWLLLRLLIATYAVSQEIALSIDLSKNTIIRGL